MTKIFSPGWVSARSCYKILMKQSARLHDKHFELPGLSFSPVWNFSPVWATRAETSARAEIQLAIKILTFNRFSPGWTRPCNRRVFFSPVIRTETQPGLKLLHVIGPLVSTACKRKQASRCFDPRPFSVKGCFPLGGNFRAERNSLLYFPLVSLDCAQDKEKFRSARKMSPSGKQRKAGFPLAIFFARSDNFLLSLRNQL